MMPERYVGVDFARRFVSDSFVPDDIAVEESVSFIRRTAGECRIYGIGETGLKRIDGDRGVNFIEVVPNGNIKNIRKKLALGLANMHLDARVEVITEAQMETYRDDPNSISHEAIHHGVLLRRHVFERTRQSTIAEFHGPVPWMPHAGRRRPGLRAYYNPFTDC